MPLFQQDCEDLQIVERWRLAVNRLRHGIPNIHENYYFRVVFVMMAVEYGDFAGEGCPSVGRVMLETAIAPECFVG